MLVRVKPTERFTNRVADYLRSRPGYPEELFDALKSHARLSGRSAVADIGSGTGLSTEPLLARSGLVYAVEPNEAMRAAAEARLSRFSGFRSVAGTAEATTLPDASVDLVTAGQAFHWFDPAAARAELHRILRRRGWVALFWNTRRAQGNPFMAAYGALLETYGTDYRRVTHEHLSPEALESFFGGPYEAMVFDHAQQFDFEGLRGRLVSSSYVPAAGEAGHEAMLARLREIFDTHQQEGQVQFPYDTELFIGRLSLGASTA
jgi:SAM-dependent methyltransferase